MVREEDVKLMSRIAIYEKRQGRSEIPVNSFYKGDYVRLNALKNVVSATITFVLTATITIAYKLDYILANVLKLDYKRLGMILLAVYAVWVCVYWLIARVLYAKRYEDARPNILIYNHRLKKLQEARQKETVKAKGGVVLSDDFTDF
ncbi:MAG: hypothetical protein IJ801_05305 [Lachnospiraceae bacterium]|nr:hypothetical protein [Lachnospiraceae bacterium]